MSQSSYRIGIDVGGTNTDAVLMAGRAVVASAKSFTTPDVRDGVVNAVRKLLESAGLESPPVQAVMIGTTQFINAFVQRQQLSRVSIIRIALPKGDGIPPTSGWPDDLVEAIDPEIHMVGGGAYYTGKDYAAFDADGVRAAAEQSHANGIGSFAISAGFSPIRPDLEERAEAIVRAVAEQHGGRALLRETGAAGSTFELLLPRA